MFFFGGQDLVLGYKITILLYNDEKAMLHWGEGGGVGGWGAGGCTVGCTVTRIDVIDFPLPRPGAADSFRTWSKKSF
jgi:hypothetical protein